MLEFSIVTITAFVTAANEVVKIITSTFNKDIKKYLPMISIILGIGLGIAGYYTPNVVMGNNLLESIFIGMAAGASATGMHQVTKQLTKKEEAVPEFTVGDISSDLIYNAVYTAISDASLDSFNQLANETAPTESGEFETVSTEAEDSNEEQKEIVDTDDYSDDE